MSLSAEKKLALKISLISFFVLIFILGSIISSSYLYGKNRAFSEFMNERRAFEGIRLIESIAGMPLSSLFESGKSMDDGGRHKAGPRKGPRDVLVFDKSKNIIKNDVIELDEGDTTKLFALGNKSHTTITLHEKIFLVAREDIGEYTLFLLYNLNPLHEYYEQLLFIALLGSLFGFIIIFLMANHLAKLTIMPIREHNEELKAYSHNVAHELRTPLAVMRSNLELLQMKPTEKLINSTNEEIAGMERIIDTLLFLAKPGENHTEKEEINITEEITEIIASYTEQDIQFSHPKKIVKQYIHRELFKRVVRNLLDNAIKYRTGGIIDIKLSEKGLCIKNQITNDFSKEEIENIKKAFYQGDTSRSGSGYGLGLALVAKIIETQGWYMFITGSDKKFSVEIEF